jgi:tripartite-type tricarboxylate transporter receptor subunit TctC
MQPMSRRFGKELFQGNALSAHQKLAFWLELPDKGFDAGERFASAPAFDFNRNHRLAFLQDEIHFMVPFALAGKVDVRAETGIEQMRADTGFNQPSPVVAVLSGLGERAAVLGAYQRGVQHLQLGAGTALAHLPASILGQPGQPADA